MSIPYLNIFRLLSLLVYCLIGSLFASVLAFLCPCFTYMASHPIACDGCYHARAVAGGEYLLPDVVADQMPLIFLRLIFLALRPTLVGGSWRIPHSGSFRKIVTRQGFYSVVKELTSLQA